MEYPKRKPTRLRGYDYSNPNYYFVTICTHDKTPIFGEVDKPNEYESIAEAELISISKHFSGVRIDKYAIMPNHIHAIIIIGCDGEVERTNEAERSRPFPTLSTIVGLYKSGVSKQIHKTQPNIKIWQKSFYERVVRNEAEYREIWQYIDENKLRWAEGYYE